MKISSSVQYSGIFLLLLLSFFHVTDAQGSYFTCPSSVQNYTTNSNFEKNLSRLLAFLKSNASLTGFYNTTVGQTPDQVYGLVQCRRDVSADDCSTCATSAATQIIQDCPNKRMAVEWFDNCIFRYSMVDFFGAVDSSKLALVNSKTMPNLPRFKPFVTSLFNNLTVSATTNTSSLLYADGSVKYTDGTTLYGLTECTRDLTVNSCNSCLKASTTSMSQCCADREGARILSASCVIRYEIYPFFGNMSSQVPPPDTSAPPPATPAQPPSNPTSTTNSSSVNERPSGKSSRQAVIIAVAVLVPLFLLLCILLVCLCGRKKRAEDLPRDTDHIQGFESLIFDLTIVKAATDNFTEANKLGEGGYGPVYKGKLQDGQEIAVKRLSRYSGQGISEFKNEVQLVAKLQHRNLVRLLGCCFEGQEKILIYEYVINKSLDNFIFGDATKRQQLNWFTRFKIIQGITRGLLYLHEDSRLKVIHRDLKASNILLDKDMNAKISDFGMAKLFGLGQTQGSTSKIAGTYGYMSPEYAMQGMFSVKSDVFSFGVIMLEIISGEKNAAFYQLDSGEDLVGYAWKLWRENRALEFVNKMMPGPLQRSEIVRCIHVGLLCVQEGAADRPTMSQVVLMLGNASMTLATPSPPAFLGGRSKLQSETESSISMPSQGDTKHSTAHWSANDVTISDLDAR